MKNCLCPECEKTFYSKRGKSVERFNAILVTLCPKCRQKKIDECKREGLEYTDDEGESLEEFKLNMKEQLGRRI